MAAAAVVCTALCVASGLPAATASTLTAAPSAVRPAGEVEPLLAADACADVIVYTVRGSGEAPQPGWSATYSETWDAFDPIDKETGGSSISAGRELDVDSKGDWTVKTGMPFLYDLVQKIDARVGGQLRLSWAPIRYPAVKLPGGILRYPESVLAGERALHQTLKRQWELCGTHTRYVLAGYSQGADVINSYLRDQIITGNDRVDEFLGYSPEFLDQIAAVTLIADPHHDPKAEESYSNIDDRLAQKAGLAEVLSRPLPARMVSLTDSICLVGDAICAEGTTIPGTPGIEIHTSGYRNFIDYPVACHLGDDVVGDESAITCMADRVVWRLGVRNLVADPPEEAESAPGSTGRDVAFFIDTTGSMDDDIGAAIDFAETQADRIVALDGRVALVQYRDDGDDVPVEITTPFTSDMTEFQAGLRELYADGGGDDPEALLHALMVGFDGLEWEYGATKAAVILTDADFHEPDLIGGETLAQVERRSLQIDPVNIFPVVDRAGRYTELAARTSGEVILNNRGDTELALGRALDNIAERPVAVLNHGTYFTAAGRELRFDASRSAALGTSISEYRWDLDGDGFTDEVTDEPVINHTYPAGYSGLMQVLVVDEAGRSANASAAVLVDQAPTPGLVPRVPTATSMSVEATSVPEGVDLAVDWTVGASEPLKWVVSVDGTPMRVVDGGKDGVRTQVPHQDEPWEVTVTPMDEDGHFGPAFLASLQPLDPVPAWYRRPLVWAVATGVGAVSFMLVTWLLLRRRSPQRSTEAR